TPLGSDRDTYLQPVLRDRGNKTATERCKNPATKRTKPQICLTCAPLRAHVERRRPRAGPQEERPASASARTASAVGTSVIREVNSPALAPARIEGALPRPAARAIVVGIARSVSHGRRT